MAAGLLDALLENPQADFTRPQDVAMLAAPTEKALLGYVARAALSGQSFEHTVRLEAAVQGWCAPSP